MDTVYCPSVYRTPTNRSWIYIRGNDWPTYEGCTKIKLGVNVWESLPLFASGIVVVVAACPENCVSCTYNTGISNTVCETSDCKARYMQNTAADWNTCHGAYCAPHFSQWGSWVREPNHRQLHNSASEANGWGTPTTDSFIAQSVRLMGEGPHPQTAS